MEMFTQCVISKNIYYKNAYRFNKELFRKRKIKIIIIKQTK